MVTLHVDGMAVRCVIDRAINAGYSGRDRDKVQEHIDELAEEGVPAPDSIPTTYSVAPYTLMTDPSKIRVIGENTSGEAEVGFIVTGKDTYVVAASDHSDRKLETDSVPKAKQITPNVISKDAWRFDDIVDHWDDIQLRAWNTEDNNRELHQDSSLESLLKPKDLLEEIREEHATPLDGSCILSGTVPSLKGELTPGERFEVELHDPIKDRSLSLGYDVEILQH